MHRMEGEDNKKYVRYTRFILVFVFVVILAGGIVRTTQSGMGCPDWPTCFGMWIPPTHADQLPPDFEKYLDQQDIDHSFNVYHTWIEYINRMVGALLGLFILIHVAWSFRAFYKTKKNIFWWSLLLLIATGFQGWLGKKVVDANLAVVKITVHMVVALFIALIPVIIIHLLTAKEFVADKLLKNMATTAMVIIIIQIILGTDVREQIDEISRALHYEQRNLWIDKAGNILQWHIATGVLLTILNISVFYRSLGHESVRRLATAILLLSLGTIAFGFIMTNYNIPSFAQPMHLLFSSALFVTLFAHRLYLRT